MTVLQYRDSKAFALTPGDCWSPVFAWVAFRGYTQGMPVLNDADLAGVHTSQYAELLVQRVLPDVPVGDPGFFFLGVERKLLVYALMDVVQGEVRQVDRVVAFLAQSVESLAERFRGLQSPELEPYVSALAVLSPPRLRHAQWGIRKMLER